MCASLVLEPLVRFNSCLVLKNLSIIGQCPVNLKIAAPKQGPFKWFHLLIFCFNREPPMRIKELLKNLAENLGK
jgi:hypothetical protein